MAKTNEEKINEQDIEIKSQKEKIENMQNQIDASNFDIPLLKIVKKF